MHIKIHFTTQKTEATGLRQRLIKRWLSKIDFHITFSPFHIFLQMENVKALTWSIFDVNDYYSNDKESQFLSLLLRFSEQDLLQKWRCLLSFFRYVACRITYMYIDVHIHTSKIWNFLWFPYLYRRTHD